MAKVTRKFGPVIIEITDAAEFNRLKLILARVSTAVPVSPNEYTSSRFSPEEVGAAGLFYHNLKEASDI